MDPFHHRLVRVALAAGEPYGFCLAGGYAVQAHGSIERRSDDVDLGVDWRAYPPTQLELGPVLHTDDAVATKPRSVQPDRHGMLPSCGMCVAWCG